MDHLRYLLQEEMDRLLTTKPQGPPPWPLDAQATVQWCEDVFSLNAQLSQLEQTLMNMQDRVSSTLQQTRNPKTNK